MFWKANFHNIIDILGKIQSRRSPNFVIIKITRHDFLLFSLNEFINEFEKVQANLHILIGPI